MDPAGSGYILLLGHGKFGQFGDEPLPSRLLDRRRSTPSDVQQLICGGWSSSYARTASGEVYSMRGAKFHSVAGSPAGIEAVAMGLAADSRLSLPSGEHCVGLAVGWQGIVAAVTDAGTLASWQDGASGKPFATLTPTECAEAAAAPQRLTSVAVGAEGAVLAVSEEGGLWAWRNELLKAVPVQLPAQPSLRVRVVGVSCGRRHTALVDSNGNAYTYGWGLYGQLGHGDTHGDTSRAEPTPVLVDDGQQGLNGWPCTAVACGGWHTAFLCNPRAAGRSRDAAAPPSSLGEHKRGSGAAAAAADAAVHVAGGVRGNRLLTCGWNEGGQLGHGGSADGNGGDSGAHVFHGNASVPTPMIVPGLEGVEMNGVACGSRYTLACTEAGELWAFGWAVHGELKSATTGSMLLKPPAAQKRQKQEEEQEECWHEPVRIRTEDWLNGSGARAAAAADSGSTESEELEGGNVAVALGATLSSGGWHASVVCDWENDT